MTTTLIVPGLNSSGSAHWQTWFESQIPDAIRVIQADWKRANLLEWSSRVRREITRRPGPLLIAAHSFGALAAIQAAEDHRERIAGALLVAPADPDKFGVSDALPAGRVGFPVTIVASSNDPWLNLGRAVALAIRWGANLVDLGEAGHINAESGYGPWPFGLTLLQQLAAGRESVGIESHSYGGELIRVSDQRVASHAAAHRPRKIADDVSGFIAEIRDASATA